MSIYDQVLITGGNGMLAHAFIRALKLRNIDAKAPPRAELDIADSDALRRTIESIRPTLILNCAAHTKVDLCEQQEELANRINGSAVGDLAKLAKEIGARMVHYSTDFVFDGNSKRPYETSNPTNPLSAYGRSKLLGETQLKQINPPGWLLIRTAWVYGPNGACFPQTMVNAARAGKPLRVVSDQVGTPTYTRDLADATLALLDANATGVFHVTNTGQTNWHEFTQAILKEFDLPNPVDSITSSEWQKIRPQSAVRPAYSVLDTSAYTRATGKTLRPWREALHDYRLAVS